MTASATSAPAQPAVRGRACPLCETPEGRPCQDKPSGDHLARYLDAFTAGQLTRAYMAMVLGELVVVDACVVVGWDEPATGTWAGEVSRGVVRKDDPAPKPPGFDCDCGRRLPWPGRTQDETCPGCGAIWEHDGVGIGSGARLVKLGRLAAQDDATAVVAESIATGVPVIVEDDEPVPCECGHEAADHHLNVVSGLRTYCNMCPAGGCEAFRHVTEVAR